MGGTAKSDDFGVLSRIQDTREAIWEAGWE